MSFKKTDDKPGISIIDIVIHAFPEVKSKTRAREQIKSGAIKINDIPVKDVTARLIKIDDQYYVISEKDLNDGETSRT
jgi:ribosomal 50S subunit-recycling heat shock protein